VPHPLRGTSIRPGLVSAEHRKERKELHMNQRLYFYSMSIMNKAVVQGVEPAKPIGRKWFGSGAGYWPQGQCPADVGVDNAAAGASRSEREMRREKGNMLNPLQDMPIAVLKFSKNNQTYNPTHPPPPSSSYLTKRSLKNGAPAVVKAPVYSHGASGFRACLQGS
jgi:hypothetical protein